MKTQMIVTCATTILCVYTLALAEADDRASGIRDLPEETHTGYDLDGDETISEQERAARRDACRVRHQRRLDRWDTDGDGMLSEKEREAAREAHRQRMEEKRTDRFDEADLDEDGFLAFEEFSAIPPVERLNENHPDKPGWIFNNMDTNGDGLVNLEEFISHPPFHRRPQHRSGKALDPQHRTRGRS